LKTKISILLQFVFVIWALAASVTPLNAQGMISAPSSEEDPSEIMIESLGKIGAQEVSTIQHLLRRLGYLKDADMTREMDAATTAALLLHLQSVKISAKGLTGDAITRSLFSVVWNKEGWATGNVNGQDLVVETADVRTAQDALKKLGYVPGPADGVFGPATLSAIEIFQEDNGMKVTGLLTRNTFQNVTRAADFIGKTPSSVVHVFNWPDYINPEVIENFEKETGIRIIHDTYENASERQEVLLSVSDKYDVVLQGGSEMSEVLASKNAIEVLDRAKLPNSLYIDPAVLRNTEEVDPGNLHSVPYAWGTVGLGVNKEKLKRIKPGLKLDSLSLILDPAIAADVSKCGIAVIDEPIDIVPAFVAYTGGDVSQIGTTDLEDVEQALSKVAKYIKIVSVESYIDDLAEGKYCVVLGYSGDIFLARDMAAEKKTGSIAYSVPKEGGQLWFDLFVIPSAAKNKAGAYQFINYMMKPEVAGANTNFIQYANPISASAPFIKKELLADPGLYPPKSVMKRLAVQPPLEPGVSVMLKRIWAKLGK
jgi:putrescine transport system substrate-binding protein